MYIGQDVERTMKVADIAPSTQKTQLHHKVDLTRKANNIQGNCWWPAYSVTANYGGVADSLKNDIQSTVALVPEYPWISSDKPAKVEDVKANGKTLQWSAPKQHGKTDDVVRYVVYRFDAKTKHPNFDDAEAIVAIVGTNKFDVHTAGKYYVTALNRANIESDPSDAVNVK
jgi:hypothetical protein